MSVMMLYHNRNVITRLKNNGLCGTIENVNI